MRYTERQMTSELLDQPPFSGEPRKLFICTTPRSGSYLPCRYMINASLDVPHQYFNSINMRQIAPRLSLGAAIEGLKRRRRGPMDRLPFGKASRAAEVSFREKYIAALVPRRGQQFVFAVKLNFGQYTKVLDNPIGWNLLHGGVCVHRHREDLLSQAILTNIARATGRWSIDDAVSTTPATNLDLSDAAALDHTVEELAMEDLGWRGLLIRNGSSAISISYEQFCQDPFGFVVAHGIDIDSGLLRRGYSEPREPIRSDAMLPHKSEIIRDYLRTMQQVQHASVIKPSRQDNPAMASEPTAAT